MPNLSNPNLKQETIRSTELVWEGHLSNSLWVSTSGFHDHLDDLITQEADGNATIYGNLQKVASDGLELELNGRLAEGLEGSASYSFQETKDRGTLQFLDNSPRHLAKLNLTQPLLRKTLIVSLNSRYRSGMTTISDGHISPFSIVNFELLGRRIGKQVDLTANIYNLFDKKYYDPPSGGTTQGAIQQDGRTFRVKMTWHLGER